MTTHYHKKGLILIRTLREIRKQSPHKLNTIAEHMGVSSRTIQLWESGAVPITVTNLQKLLSFLGVSVDTIRLSDIPQLIPIERGE